MHYKIQVAYRIFVQTGIMFPPLPINDLPFVFQTNSRRLRTKMTFLNIT